MKLEQFRRLPRAAPHCLPDSEAAMARLIHDGRIENTFTGGRLPADEMISRAAATT
jgi:hypothetical protein